MEELKLVGFYYIRMRMPHLRVRDIRDLFARHESWSEVKNALAVPVELTSEQKSRLGIDPEYDLEEDEEEELQEQDEKETFTTKIEERDLREDAIWRDVHKGQLKSFFQDAKEQVQIIKDSERPLTLARRALKNIEAIPEDPEKLQEPDMDEVLSKIIARTNALRKLTPRRKSRMKKRKKMV
jgi:hypothetical protein